MKARSAGIVGCALLCAFLAACAASPARAPVTAEEAAAADAEMASAWDELGRQKAELARHRGAGDCKEVCGLSALICSAGERVCGIAGRHPEVTEYRGRCRTAEEDCKAARTECEVCR